MDEAAFESKEERALWSTYTSLSSKICPGKYLFEYADCEAHSEYIFLPPSGLLTPSVKFTEMEVDDFVEASFQLVQPLEDFFNNVFVMVVRFR